MIGAMQEDRERAPVAAADRILVRDLLVRGILGIDDWERKNKQEILVNLTLQVDTREAARSERLEDSLDYRSLTEAIVRYVESSSHYLVESLAAELARISVVGFGADVARVRVEKPGALRVARSVGVEIERTRTDFE